MAPVRIEKQVLWKKGIPDRPKRSFLEEEKQNLVDFYRLLDLVEDRAAKKEFKHLFLTLEGLMSVTLSTKNSGRGLETALRESHLLF